MAMVCEKNIFITLAIKLLGRIVITFLLLLTTEWETKKCFQKNI